jgi:hypothetical protein
MAIDFIKIDTTQIAATGAMALKNYIATLRSAYELGLHCLAIMDHNNDGTDFTPLETLFGIPVGQGQAVFDMVNGSVGSMEGKFQVADAKNITEQVG